MICHFLEEDIDGIRCRAVGVNVEYIDGADIDVCMSKRHEQCDIANKQSEGQRVVIRLKVSD